MRKIAVYGLVLGSIGLLILFRSGKTKLPEEQQSPQPSQKQTETTPSIQKTNTVTVSDTLYGYATIPPTVPIKISLISNVTNKRTTNELKEAHACEYLINGGFYDTNNHHLGLFQNDTVIQKQSQNALLNGILWAGKNGSSGIGNDAADIPLSFALQTGPILFLEDGLRTLKIVNDEGARRMVAFVLPDFSIAFASVFAEGNTYMGPLLAQLPRIAKEISNTEHWNALSAINLDGGNHSGLLTKDVSIQELSPVGSIFCIK